ncbi:MAG: hypothetical protein K0R85_918 [Devosia sp.]|jgi:hypothetical protein|nr:hypothetical protein [Devosia sp.]
MRPNNNQNNNKNRPRGRNGGRKHVNPLSRNFESTGPDVKVRGNAAHIAEKYMQLARDAQSSGDSVMAENYLQHAEHYFRIVAAAQQQTSFRPDQQGQDSEDFDDDMPEINSRFSSPQPQQPQQADNEDAPEAGERQDRSERQERPERAERQDRPERGERQERGDRPERQQRQRRPENTERVEPASEPIAAAPTEASSEEPAAPVVAQEGEGEVRKPRERRPRRRRPVGGEAGAEASGGTDEGSVGELPAFLTGGTPTPAE